MIHSRAPGTTAQSAWTATFAVLAMGGMFVATIQVARLPAPALHATLKVQDAEPVAQEPARAALNAEIDRRWPEIRAWGEALQRDHDDLQAEEQALNMLWYRIESRRRRYSDGLPPDAKAADELDVVNYDRRMTLLRTRIDSYNASLADYRRAAGEFDRLIQQRDSR